MTMDELKIIEGMKVICRCQGIRQKTFMKHIDQGAITLKALLQATGAGTGDCGGKQCAPRIEALLQSVQSD